MQVKRFVADDMRTVMRLVKEEIGADAVILSNRVVDGKVEILAARDYDETLINQALDQTLIESKPNGAAAYYERAAAERELEKKSHEPVNEKKNDVEVKKETHFSAEIKNTTQHQASGLYQHTPPTESKFEPPLTDSMIEMRDELKSLRMMIENQNVLGEWKEMSAKHPLRVSLYKRLTEMGLSQEVCKYLAKGLDNLTDVEQAMQAALKQLVHQIPLAQDDILNRGGVFAMVGPTGVGKTTSIAKLAARFAMQHGQRHVALISTDTYRIGAHEQLMTYGRLLGVSVHSANDAAELQQLLHKLQSKKLILIDTAGMSQRDIDISQQLAHLNHPSSKIKPYLVLSANAQTSTLDEVISSFKKSKPVACILTKLDEAASLGGVLSTVIKHQLPIAFVSNGQKVPEDIHPARARELVDETLAYAKQYKQNVDDDFMAVAFTTGVDQMPL
ncbi:Flagellar biosynthesis protein FlhF [hydrothermal vent metagenome]|uniref:Flagellar biosynthesis protein FlhF n=1 Tax=hydrothermal vent metagenome TaxID=652676 RepID=A0A3B0X8M5_9ZZZZ